MGYSNRALGLLLLTTLACAEKDDGDEAAADSSGSSSSADSGASSDDGPGCTPGETASCICHQGGTEGTMTCLPDGSGFGACEGECACPPGRSDGCCAGDGICCSCVLGCDPATDFDQDPETDALIACVCEAGVCDDACSGECLGQGIGADCAPCVEQAGMDACMAEHAACQPS
jgi:hypothetical protein